MNKPVMNFDTRAGRARTDDILSAVEERNLVRAWQGHGDKRARDRLINAFTPLATSVAKRCKRGTIEPDPDLVQQAHIGLMKAADSFAARTRFREAAGKPAMPNVGEDYFT